jgi:hypothetical protein
MFEEKREAVMAIEAAVSALIEQTSPLVQMNTGRR